MDTQTTPTWALMAAALAGAAFAALVGGIVLMGMQRRGRSRRLGESSEGSGPAADRRPAETTIVSAARRRATPQPEAATDPRAVPNAVRQTILQSIAERCPAGWTALVLCPPPLPEQMIWHVHLRADVALDLVDGRTIPTSPPAATQQWSLPSGRTAEQAFGDPIPAPGGETRAIRVTGLHLSATHQLGSPGAFFVRVASAKGGLHEYRAKADAVARLGPLLDEGIARAIYDARHGEAASMGYSPPSWSAHERAWLWVLGR